ncbi:tetratricopeptide repeat protein [Umezawaea sp.]|uniref:tetratricopeptide repeat protein n=1 Tax=Umezawaea sp. TaxID=1955258 RepID=UPI002ED0CBEC
MSRARDTLSNDAELLLCFQVLDSPTLPARTLAAGAKRDPGELDRLSTRHDQAPAGVVRLDEDLFGWRPDVPALHRPWTEPARLVTRRLGEDLLTTLDAACDRLGRPVTGFAYPVNTPFLPPMRFSDAPQATSWVRRHLSLTLATVRAGGTARLRSLATALTARLWACAPTDAPRHWAVDLVEAGTRAAIDDRQPHTLAGLLRLSARWFATQGDFVTAEAHGVREWVVWKELDDTTGMIDTLWRRAVIYRQAGRGNRELDCYQRLLSLYRHTGDRFGLARAQTARGVTLAATGRARDAAEQLRDAARLVEDPDDLPGVPPVELAGLLETMGRACWSIGATGTARRHFSDALRLLVDVDEQVAHRIRTLLATPENHPLPGNASRSVPP